MASKGRKKKQSNSKKIALLVVELLIVVVLIALAVVVWGITRIDKSNTGTQNIYTYIVRNWITRIYNSNTGTPGMTTENVGNGPQIAVDFNEEEIAIPEQVTENEVMKGYRNIALFGVDSRDGVLTTGTLSDCIIVASINQETGDVKLVSVYRDTVLRVYENKDGSEKYAKANNAYSHGGAKCALEMLNSNLDLDITEFITIGFEGLSKVIDALGGVYIDINSTELKHINNYQLCMAEEMGISYTEVTDTGYQLLNGLQATAYCRIRYTAGNDYARAARQREVIQAVMDVAKKANAKQLIDAANAIASYIYTSFTMDEILAEVVNVAKYNIVDEGGFPEESMRGSDNLGKLGSCVYAIDLESNVTWLHKFLFDEDEYVPSALVHDRSEYIRDFVGQYTSN